MNAVAWSARLLRARWFVRLPILLYRWRLGAVFGRRLLMLEHIGRRSGEARYAVLEVVDRPSGHTFVVVSGFGDHAQWYRNVVANPAVRVFVGSHRPMPAKARVLSREQAADALAAYQSSHPHAWESLRPVLEQLLEAPIDVSNPTLPMVALDVG